LIKDILYLFQFILGSGKNYDDFVFVENVAHSHICAEKTLSNEEGAKIVGGQVSHQCYTLQEFGILLILS
jgi:hypothetical protein